MSDGGTEGLSPMLGRADLVTVPGPEPPPLPGEGAGQDTVGGQHAGVSAAPAAQAGGSLPPLSMEQTYSSATAGDSSQNKKIVDVIQIVLKKTRKEASYYLGHRDKAKLVFFLLKIPRNIVVGIDQADHRTLRVFCTENADKWRVAHSITVKEGIITLPMRLFKRLTTVKVQWAGIEINEQMVVDMLRKFGTFHQEPVEVHKCKYFEKVPEDKLSMEEKLMVGLETGDKEVQMYVHRQIPSYGLLENGRRVRIDYPAQAQTCSRCHQGIRGCKGKANAAKCEKAGGPLIPLEEHWKIITAGEPDEADLSGEISEISVVRLEGTNPRATTDNIREILAPALTREVEDGQMLRSEDGKAWTVKELATVEIRNILNHVSGMQYSGRTIFVTPLLDIVSDNSNKENSSKENSNNSETGQKSQEGETPEKEGEEDPEKEGESSSEMDTDSDNDDQIPTPEELEKLTPEERQQREWQTVERRKKKEERRRLREEERKRNPNFKKPPSRVGSRKRRPEERSPGSVRRSERSLSKKRRQEKAASSASSQSASQK